jgi:hypothetical protein
LWLLKQNSGESKQSVGAVQTKKARQGGGLSSAFEEEFDVRSYDVAALPNSMNLVLV